PMHRLLQGDVGSGKTLVALTALLAGVAGGHQGALMAPTEVLAEQHDLSLRQMLGELSVEDDRRLGGRRPVSVGLLTNRTTAAERQRLAAGLADHSVDLLVGTHALVQESVSFADLGVVVIDEQHRFGVEQRAALRAKGGEGAPVPDVLVMTATPIPRTAAMTVYGDLDLTTLDELPPGRTPVITRWLRPDGGAGRPAAGSTGPGWELVAEEAYQRVRDEVAAGHQAYVVCPLVEESDKIAARSAKEEYDRLASEVWPELSLGLLHGQMPAKEREPVMAAFRRGDLDVLVSTTVIEVGVDVPNATVMLIEDADRFGIAQLHQLRGRVGRGADRSWCYLLGGGSTTESAARLAAVEASTDGFELAEVDLDLRGEGTVLGTRQKGRNDLRLASLRRDRETVVLARQVAEELLGDDPELEGGDHSQLGEEVRLLVGEEDATFLLKS
ncbi:MAG: ATP-dependent DNA helicase RecG, partial [Acidimicrobiales bacterium]